MFVCWVMLSSEQLVLMFWNYLINFFCKYIFYSLLAPFFAPAIGMLDGCHHIVSIFFWFAATLHGTLPWWLPNEIIPEGFLFFWPSSPHCYSVGCFPWREEFHKRGASGAPGFLRGSFGINAAAFVEWSTCGVFCLLGPFPVHRSEHFLKRSAESWNARPGTWVWAHCCGERACDTKCFL